jgi:predicted molibdopterin-dependent oxidoreductase YjgC
MSSLTVTIDGHACAAEAGEYIAAIAARNGIEVPVLCGRVESLLGRGCCRVCMVELEEGGRARTVAACIYPVTRDCEVRTRTERIARERAVVLTLLARLAPDSEEIARMLAQNSAPGIECLDALTPVGRYCADADDGAGAAAVVESGAGAGMDAGRCILCGLCVEACARTGAGAISTAGRGVDKTVCTPYGEPSPACVGCASCAAVCPTGAIIVSERCGEREIWGRRFKLARCEVCGEALGTEESLAYAAQRAAGRAAGRAADSAANRAAAGELGPGLAAAPEEAPGRALLCSKHRSLDVARGFLEE